MAIQTICSGCGQKLAVADEHAGKRARCPACGQIYTIPMPADRQADVSASAASPDNFRRSDPLAETTAGDSSSPWPATLNQPQPAEQYWMQTKAGDLYGPVERAKLNRWFSEGRIGPGYQIRVGEAGLWQSADLFRPQTQVGDQATWADAGPNQRSGTAEQFRAGNPYAEKAYQPTTHPTSMARFQKGDPSGLVLTMGILAWVCLLVCPLIHWIPGLVAWISGSAALRDIRSGIADPSNLTLVQVGYYLGMINVVLSLLFVAVVVALAALSAIGQNF
jgi:hypothetical protein